MIPVDDDTLYHHERVVRSRGSLSKKKLIELMKKHKVEYIDLPFTTRGRADLCQMEGHEDHHDVKDRGDSIIISVDDKEPVSRAVINKPRVANCEELKFGFVTYLKEVDPSLLEYKVEKCVWDRGHRVL